MGRQRGRQGRALDNGNATRKEAKKARAKHEYAFIINQKSWSIHPEDPSENDLTTSGLTTALQRGQVVSLSSHSPMHSSQ